MKDIITAISELQNKPENFLTEDVTITVGATEGNDFITLNEAILHVSKHNISAGLGAAGYGAKRNVLWTIQLDSGDVDLYELGTLIGGQIRWEGQYNQVRIQGNADGTTRLVLPAGETDDYLWWKINHCVDIKLIDILEIQSYIEAGRSRIKIFPDKSSIATFTCHTLSAWPDSTMEVAYDLELDSLLSDTNSWIRVNGNVTSTGSGGIAAYQGSTLIIFGDVTFNGAYFFSTTNSNVTVTGNMTVTPSAGQTIFNVQDASNIVIRGTYTNNSIQADGEVFNKILTDGSYISIDGNLGVVATVPVETGETKVENMVFISQADYDNITPVEETLYIITPVQLELD